MVRQIYPTELQLNIKQILLILNPFKDLDSPITNEIVSFEFYDVYFSQLICFARVCSNIDDLDNRNKILNAKWLKVSQYDQVMPQSHTAGQPMEHVEEIQNTTSHTTARRRFN